MPVVFPRALLSGSLVGRSASSHPSGLLAHAPRVALPSNGPICARSDAARQCVPRLKWMQSTWAGVNALAGTARRDYACTRLAGCFGAQMTEYVLGAIMVEDRPRGSRPSVALGLCARDGRGGALVWGTLGSPWPARKSARKNRFQSLRISSPNVKAPDRPKLSPQSCGCLVCLRGCLRSGTFMVVCVCVCAQKSHLDSCSEAWHALNLRRA